VAFQFLFEQVFADIDGLGLLLGAQERADLGAG